MRVRVAKGEGCNVNILVVLCCKHPSCRRSAALALEFVLLTMPPHLSPSGGEQPAVRCHTQPASLTTVCFNTTPALTPSAAPSFHYPRCLQVVGNMLFAVNAGSNTLSVFSIDPSDPTKCVLGCVGVYTSAVRPCASLEYQTLSSMCLYACCVQTQADPAGPSS